jgi:hypothetical protein
MTIPQMMRQHLGESIVMVDAEDDYADAIEAPPGADDDLCNTVSARFVAFYAAEVAPC